MPWLTPDSIPEDDDCRPLFIPADSVWLALVSGALTELIQPFNWQKFGTLTVQETVDKMQEIIDGYYDTACLACTFPDGGKIIRIDDTGHIQQLDDGGTWTDPTGDYVIPPPAARTGGTTIDQNCLAAKNAVNVLHALYTSLSDSFSAHLTEAEALTAFIGVITAAVGFEFAPITFGIAVFFEAVFQALFQAIAYLTADLWDDAVNKQIECFLLACASNDAGVVTFDYECFIGKLNSLTDDFLLSETQLRLYLQITYILYFIGGIDGLNLAATTTEITDSDCGFCNEPWCFEVDLTDNDGGFNILSGLGTYLTGVGWAGVVAGSGTELRLDLLFSPDILIQYAEISYEVFDAFLGTNDLVRGFNTGSLIFTLNGTIANHGSGFETVCISGDADIDRLVLAIDTYSGGSSLITHFKLKGLGTLPELTGWTECDPDSDPC